MSSHLTNGRARRIRRALAVGALAALLGACGSQASGESASAPPTSKAQAPSPSPSSSGSGAPAPQETATPRQSESGGGESAGEQTAVTIKNFAFKPPTVNVQAGATVVWTNKDSFAHTVTAGQPGAQQETFDGQLGELNTNDNQGKMFSHRFEEPGSYAYFCRFHPNMRGTVEVQ